MQKETTLPNPSKFSWFESQKERSHRSQQASPFGIFPLNCLHLRFFCFLKYIYLLLEFRIYNSSWPCQIMNLGQEWLKQTGTVFSSSKRRRLFFRSCNSSVSRDDPRKTLHVWRKKKDAWRMKFSGLEQRLLMGPQKGLET